MEQMQGLDSAFVAFERANAPQHIGSIIIYDPSTAPGGFVRFKDILSFIEDRLRLSKTMRRRMVKAPFNIDYPYWIEDPDFDLEYHVRHIALPKPGDWRQLCIQAARLFARPLDLSRPPWELTVIEGLDNVEGVPKGAYAMVPKVHHSAIDGMSGVDMMHALHTLHPTVEPPETRDEWVPERAPGQIRLFARGSMRGMANPLRQMDVARKSMPGFMRAMNGLMRREFDLDAVMKTPRTRFNHTVSSARVAEGRTFPLKDIKAIRALAPGSKVNDVMLTIVGGAMRRYMQAHDELPDASMTAAVPISVRDEGEKNKGGNQVTAMVAPLGTHIANAQERLAFVHEATVQSKAMTKALGARQMTEQSKIAPYLYIGLGAQLYSRLGLANRVKPTYNTVITNVPGPTVPMYSAGAKMIKSYGLLCLLDGSGIGHVVQSYVDMASIAFTACRDMMPDPEFYSECLQASFDEYHQLAEKLHA